LQVIHTTSWKPFNLSYAATNHLDSLWPLYPHLLAHYDILQFALRDRVSIRVALEAQNERSQLLRGVMSLHTAKLAAVLFDLVGTSPSDVSNFPAVPAANGFVVLVEEP